MFCQTCGSELPPTGQFCGSCGAPRDAAVQGAGPRKRGKGWLWFLGGIVLAAAVAVGLFLTGVVPQTAKQEGRGFDTPEAAVEAYVQALSTGDMQGMLQTFAQESFVSAYRLDKQIERMQGFTLVLSPRFPNDTQLLRDLNLGQRQSDLVRSIGMQYATLSLPADSPLLQMQLMPLHEPAEIEALLQSLRGAEENQVLQSLQLQSFEDPAALTDTYLDQANQKNIERQRAVYGCEKIQAMAAKVEAKDQTYLFCFDAAQYDGRWYLLSFSGNIGALLNCNPSAAGILAVDEIW